jgi:hypothetical protein
MASQNASFLLFSAIIMSAYRVSLSKTIIEIKFTRYQDRCREDANTNKCDPKFRFCLDKPRQTATMSPCLYGLTRESGHFQDTNYLDLDSMSNIKGIPNPWIIHTAQSVESSLLLVFQVRDDDFFGDDDHLQTWGIILKEKVYPSRDTAIWVNNIATSNSHTMIFQIRIYCEAGYFGPSCINHCTPSDNPSGHYTCDPSTGAKICMKGWTGSNCNEDVNECLLNYCGIGTCENIPADYTCHCPPLHTGKNCTIMKSACDMDLCSNNATCTDLPDLAYNCACVGDWEGQNCSIKRNPCRTQPCQNGAKCIASGDHLSYSCICVGPYTGLHCDTVVPDVSTLPATESFESNLSQSKMSESESSQMVSSESPEITALLSPEKLTTLSSKNMAGVAAERTNTRETSTETATIQHWHGALIALVVLAIIAAIIICLVVRQRQRKRKLNTSEATSVYNNNKLAFENNLYNDVSRDSVASNERHREHPPLPSTPTDDDQFMPIKPLFAPSNIDVQGAEGGTHLQFEMDMDPDGYVKPSSHKSKMYTKEIDKPLRCEQTENNHYTDFNRLRSKPETQESVEECHFYHDLDEIALAVKGLSNAAKEFPEPQMDQEETAYNDTPSNIPVAAHGLASGNQSGNYESPGDSFVFINTAPDNFYSEPAKPRESSQTRPVEHPSTFGNELCEDVKLDMPQINDSIASEVSSDGDEVQDYGLQQVASSHEGDYCTPRGLQADSSAPECQYDTPPNNHSSKILTGSYNGAPRFCKPTRSPSTKPTPLIRSSANTQQNRSENLKNKDMEDGLPTLLPDVPASHLAPKSEISTRTGSIPCTDEAQIGARTDTDIESCTSPISVVKGCTFGTDDEKSSSNENRFSIQKGSQSKLNNNIFLESYNSSNT